jgi:murein L,D-transpeptidase YafK
MKRRTLLISGLGLLFAAGSTPVGSASPTATPVALTPGIEVDRIVVRKSRRELTLFRDGIPLKTYRIALGFGEPGAKRREGDGRTPEGRYRISGRNPDSAYHLSLRISFPAPRDVAAARARGEEPGSDIMIHGLPNGFGWIGVRHRIRDWTAGCIAVTNAEIEEIWQAVPDGTPIEIAP